MQIGSSPIKFLVLTALAFVFTLQASVVNYDIVYIRAPRFGDNENSLWPEVFHPARSRSRR
jgi:hypothetical protein